MQTSRLPSRSEGVVNFVHLSAPLLNPTVYVEGRGTMFVICDEVFSISLSASRLVNELQQLILCLLHYQPRNRSSVCPFSLHLAFMFDFNVYWQCHSRLIPVTAKTCTSCMRECVPYGCIRSAVVRKCVELFHQPWMVFIHLVTHV